MDGSCTTIASLGGMVAAAHPLAAEAGAKMLAEGGNAFDAAAATAAALNVVEPFMSSLAGLGSATMWVAAEQRVRALDFVIDVPMSFPAGRFKERAELERGPQSVATPGNLAGWCELVSRYGSKPLADIFAPAIALAANGFPLADFGITEFNEQRPILERQAALWPALQSAYFDRSGPVKVGTLLHQPDLAETYRSIAKDGPRYLYEGDLGKRIVAYLQSMGGTLTMADLARAKPVWKEPLAVSYRGLQIHVPPPPCEGFQFLLALKILEGFDLQSMERDGVDHLDTVCRAIRLAAGLRTRHNNPSSERLAELFSDKAIAEAQARVRDGVPITGPTEQWTPDPPPGEDPGHTTSMSIADKYGNLICLTNSIGSPFGSGVVVPGTGLCLNNFLYWTDVKPGSPNLNKPGDPIAMCMSPSISTLDGKPVLALGTPGSYGIMQTQVQAIVQHLDFGLGLQHAINAPRARLWDGRTVQIENRISAETIATLRERGHDISAFDVGYTMKVGGMQAIRVDPESGVLIGAADPRRDGRVVPVPPR